jgi:dipeptidyl aminopeptidase/acylaminoacyl peptidase
VAGNNLNVKIISFAKSETPVSYYLSVRSADDYSYTSMYEEKKLSAGINSNTFGLPTEKLLPGGCKIVWKCSDNSEGEIPLSILPVIEYDKEKAYLDKLNPETSRGDYNTMLFTLQNLVTDYKKLKPYETAGAIRERFNAYTSTFSEIRINSSYLSEKPGISRRAFLSAIDSTLQPYTVKLPANFDRKKKYPLFVMLHGSGSDDQGMLNNQLTENDFIEIAPYGRGTSNCFTTDGAEMDVIEAIEDAIINYPVNASEIILAGFSMGGYGAYRIYHEYPGMFKGIAVFSGHPNLATQWLGEGFPDFLDPANLKAFRDTPVFICHSKNDLNCPYGLTGELIEKLKNAGAKVEFVSTGEGGHGIIDKENLPLYFNWLKDTVEK